MEEKYYTPTIEEFHVGFEYERCDDGYSYFKDTFPRAINLELFFKHSERFLPYMRVKCLDREDILSLGWIDKIQTDKYYLIVDGDEIQFYPDAYHSEEGQGIGCQIFYKLGDKINEMAVWIKNITELRQLMKFHGWLKQE